jgi:outer membrane protein, heavy metal efflux system
MKPLVRCITVAALLGMILPGVAVAQEPPLTLAGVYRMARERNPRLRAAGALVDARRAMETSAGLPPDPALQVGVMNFSVPGFDTDMPTSMAPSVQAMQMLPIGKLGLTRNVAAQTTAIAAADAEEAWWEVRGRAAMAFHELWRADREIVVMRANLRWLESFETVAQAMYAVGEGRQSDVLRARVEIARVEADVARMEAMRAGASARLNAVLDRPADTPIPDVALAPLPRELPPSDTLRAWAERDRPMLGRGRTEVERARTRSSLARRELWPDVILGMAYGQRSLPADEMGGSGTERMGSVMVGFSLPVFARQRQLRMRAEARAMERMAEADLASMRAEVGARLGELRADLRRSLTLIELYRADVLPQAQATVESALSSYRVGRVDFMTLIDAQMTKNDYERELAALWAEYGTGVAELEMTIGRELPAGTALLVEVP